MKHQPRDLAHKHVAKTIILYVVLGIISFIVLFPFVFTVSASIVERFTGISSLLDLVPSKVTLLHYKRFVTDLLFWRWMFNSIFVAGVVAVAKMFIDSAAGYVLAKRRFAGRGMLINLSLLAMAVPFTVTFLPSYFLVNRLGWINTYWVLIIPPLSMPMGVFLALQFMRTIPTELMEAGKIDGCSEFTIYWRIILPVCKPLLGALGIYYFLVMWVSFLWPLVTVTNEEMKVIPVALAGLRSQYLVNYSIIAAVVVISFFPIAAFFLAMQSNLNKVISLSVVRK